MNKLELIKILDTLPDDIEISVFDYGKLDPAEDTVMQYEVLDVMPWISDDNSEQLIAFCIDSGYETALDEPFED